MDNLTGGNPLAHRVRVYYDGSSKIAEGMPICYNYLTTDNWWGGSVNDRGEVTANETTAEGSHNKGKYIYVCNPICVNSIEGTPAANVITAVADEFDNLQVGMFVSIASAAEAARDGNYKITAVDVANDTITLDMTTPFAGVTNDVTVKIDNIHAFAGVVAKGGWCGRAGPKVLDIYVPNGAIVPVKTVLAATVAGRTILSIVSATQTFGNPTTDVPDYGSTAGTLDSRPVAIAAESVSSAGLVLAKLDDRLFIYQGGQVDQELQVGYVGAVDTAVNRMNLSFAQTLNHCCALHYRSKITGTGDAKRGVYRFETIVTGIQSESLYSMDNTLELDANQTHGVNMSVYKATVRTRNFDPDLSNLNLSCFYVDWVLTATTGDTLSGGHEPVNSSIFHINSDGDGTQPDYLFFSEGYTALAISTVNKDQGADCVRAIKINAGGIDYYIATYTLAELTS